MSKVYRIKDIAAMSGVSTGTVDRILHNRGRVSEEAKRKVEKVLKEIDYHPNLIARSLALKKTFRFISIMPACEKGDYWSHVYEGVSRAESELYSYHVEVSRLTFDQFDQSSFEDMIPYILESECQGVIIGVPFADSVALLAAGLDKLNIPYVLVDVLVENTNYLAYYGSHSFDSGYLAGRLLCEQIHKEEDIALFQFRRKGEGQSNQVQRRQAGFESYLKKQGYRGHFRVAPLLATNEEATQNLLDLFFDTHAHIRSGIIFNSRVYEVANYIKKRPERSGFRLIGYDAIEKNIECLHDSIVSHLVGQRPEIQGYYCVRSLFRHLVLKEKIKKINYMPLDILMKENIDYYNNYI